MVFEKEEKAGRRPDFVAFREGVSVWTNQDKNGKPYLTVHIPLLNIRVNAFKVDDDAATCEPQDG